MIYLGNADVSIHGPWAVGSETERQWLQYLRMLIDGDYAFAEAYAEDLGLV